PERFANALQKTGLLTVVYALHFFQQSEWRSKLVTDGDECGNVFWETRAAIPDSSVQKIAPDTVIHPDPVGHFFHVGSARFANRRHRVDIRNFQSQERVRTMFDKLGTANVGHEDRGHEGLVHLFHQIDRAFALRSDHDPIGMHEIGHCAAFAQKLWITDYVKFCAMTIISFD